MKGAQQVIKALAIAFAVVLVCGIGAAIIGASGMMGYLVGGFDRGDDSEWTEMMIPDQEEFDELVIEMKATNVRIEQGEVFQVLADEEVVEFRRNGEKVELKEKDWGFFGNWHKVGGEVKVILPRDLGNLQKVEIETGAGAVYAEGVSADEVKLELGAGRAEFVGLVAKEKMKISGGAGYLAVREAELTDLDLDMGVGKVEISGRIQGDSDIDAGVGKLEMTLKGGQDDYKMKFNKGIGSITVNGASMGDKGVWGNGANVIRIDGGVGAIEIRVEEE